MTNAFRVHLFAAGQQVRLVLAFRFRRGHDAQGGQSQSEGNGDICRRDGGCWWHRSGRLWEFEDDDWGYGAATAGAFILRVAQRGTTLSPR
jgi:hypothetical protein